MKTSSQTLLSRHAGRALLATLMLIAVVACATREDDEEKRQANRTDIPVPIDQPVKLAEERQPLTTEMDAANLKHEPAMALRRDAAIAAYSPMPNVQRDNFQHQPANPVMLARETPVSTFSVDVDTGSYSVMRRWLNDGVLPPQDAVRVEEMINYFDYHYPKTGNAGQPFSVHTELARAPWNRDALLLKIGLQAHEVSATERPPANLVFLVDVSGSMQSPDKIGLLKQSLLLLVQTLRPEDTISLMTYAGQTAVLLEPTGIDRQAMIRRAIDQLAAGGSTNGGAGIQLAYDMAEQGFIRNGINRIILATDGDFNVGVTRFESLIDLVETGRETGVTLTTLGFGRGNYNDHLMEQLADAGNGNYAYIDNLQEGKKILVDELSSTLQIVAKDVKAQIEFNPALVAEYRLIGYENRVLAREDFNNDKVDAGDIGAGHTVTALYEIILVDSGAQRVDPLRYGHSGEPADELANELEDELAWLKLRYKLPTASHSTRLEFAIHHRSSEQNGNGSPDMQFAAAVAAFGQKLSGSPHLGEFSYPQIVALARANLGDDTYGYRREFASLVEMAALHDRSSMARHD